MPAMRGRRIGDVVESQNLWPDLPRRPIEDLAVEIPREATEPPEGTDEFSIQEVRFLKGDNGEYAIMKVCDSDGELFTCSGGSVITAKMREVEAQKAFPVIVRFVSRRSKNKRLYHDVA